MSLHIEDTETTRLIDELADQLQTSKEIAVKRVVKAALEKLARERTFDQRLDEFYKSFPKPARTGLPADKAFFDELSGEFD